MNSVSTFRKKQDPYSFPLPGVFTSLNASLPVISPEEYEMTYLGLELRQREAVFKITAESTHQTLLTKITHAWNHLELEDKRMKISRKFTKELFDDQKNAHAPIFDSFLRVGPNPPTSPLIGELSPSRSLVISETLKFLKTQSKDFLRNQKRCKSRAAYKPDLWHRIFEDALIDNWAQFDAAFAQILEFKFLLEYHFSPDSPFARIKLEVPSERPAPAPEPMVVDEDALVAELEGEIVKPKPRKAKKVKKVVLNPRPEITDAPRAALTLPALRPLPGVRRSLRNSFYVFSSSPQARARPRTLSF